MITIEDKTVAHKLFRAEAVEAKRETLIGEVVVANPLSVSLLTAIGVAFVLALGAFLYWGEYTRKSHVKGYLVPTQGLIKVYPPQTGIIVEQHIEEGQFVEQGEQLLVISTERSSRQTRGAQAAIIRRLKERRDSLKKELRQQAEIDRIQRQNFQSRLRGLISELEQVVNEQQTQGQRVDSAKGNERRLQTLSEKKYIPVLQAEEAYEKLLEQKLQLQRIHRERTKLEREISGLKLDLASDKLQAANRSAAIERQIAALEQELTDSEVQRQSVVTAPIDGTLSTILTKRGQVANPNAPLLSILPAGTKLEAHLLVPSKAIGFMQAGQAITVRYQAFPYQRFGSYNGHIQNITKTLLMPNDAQLPVELSDPAYLVSARLESQSVWAYQNDVPLQSGMLFDADVWLEQRRLYEWLLEPLLSVKGRI